MSQCTAAICLAQLETIRENVRRIDRMARLLTKLLAEIPGVVPLSIPDYTNVYSCWMFSFSIDPDVFACAPDKFARQLAEAGILGAGLGKYYLMPAACTFLNDKARNKIYPYSAPPASRAYRYGADACPRAKTFLETWIRWATFCEKYETEDCELAARIVRDVADRNRK